MNIRILCRTSHKYAYIFMITFRPVCQSPRLTFGSWCHCQLQKNRLVFINFNVKSLPHQPEKVRTSQWNDCKHFSVGSASQVNRTKYKDTGFKKKEHIERPSQKLSDHYSKHRPKETLCRPRYQRHTMAHSTSAGEATAGQIPPENEGIKEENTSQDIGKFSSSIIEQEGSIQTYPVFEVRKNTGSKTGAPRRREKVQLSRIVKRERKKKDGINNPDVVHLQVVGTGSRENPRSVILSVDGDACYLFNCGEGTQRIISEKRMKLAQIDDIFITHKSWKNVGGLLGMVLSLEAFHVPKVNIHGPEGVEYPVSLARDFSEVDHFELARVPPSDTEFTDHNLQVTSVQLEPSKSAAIKEQEGPSAKRRKTEAENGVSYAYIVKLNPGKKRLDFEKCVELGMRKEDGILWGKLQRGEEITLKNGTVVKAEEVTRPDPANFPFLILEVPSEAYLDAVTKNPQLRALQESENKDGQAMLVVHMTPEHVVQSPQYQDWMNSFPTRTDHLILNEACNGVAHTGIYDMQAKLSLLHERIFPLLPNQLKQQSNTKENNENLPNSVEQVNETNEDSDAEAKTDIEDEEYRGSIMYGETSLKYHLRPRKTICRKDILPLDNEAFRREVTGVATFESMYSDYQEKVKAKEAELSSLPSYPEIIFLGTASSIPGKYRNVSSIMLRLSEDKCMLLDCGEGTIGQLYRHFGDDTSKMLQGMEAVYLSHLHADHHMGLYSVLNARAQALAEVGEDHRSRCLLLAPGVYHRWQHVFDTNMFPYDHLINHVPLEYLWEGNVADHKDQYAALLEQLQLSQLRTVRVYHKQNPHGLILTHRDGWKLVYSGDTKPCGLLIKEGLDCDILIHEATMEDELSHLAAINKHSTTSQAIEVGVNMRARFILLTHFSQRYSHTPPINERFNDRVGVAFDNMRVRMRDLQLLPIFSPLLKEMFKEKYEMMEEKSNKLLRKKEKEKRAREQASVSHPS